MSSPPPPSTERKDRKHAEIVAIARAMFFREGYARTSMSQIAAALGGSKTTLYNHFGSKEDLFLAVVHDVVDPNPEDYDAATEPSEFRAWLGWFGLATVKRITSEKYIGLQRLAAGEALQFPEVGRVFYEVGVAPSYAMVSEVFAGAIARGDLRAGDPALAAEHFLELCLGWMLRRVIWNIQPVPSEAEMAKRVAAAVEAFMDGHARRS